jgi:hypothetical protein
MFALGLGLLAAATVGAIAPVFAAIAFIGAALVGISLPMLIEAIRKGP